MRTMFLIAEAIVLFKCHTILASQHGASVLNNSKISYKFELAPAPSPFPTSQAYYNSSTWSWGGSIVHVPEDHDGFPFHLFAEAEVGACGVHAWQTNARVIHARAKTPEGPYVFVTACLQMRVLICIVLFYLVKNACMANAHVYNNC